MVSLAEEKGLYSEIQKKLFYIIPEKWDSIYLYASILDEPNKKASGEMYFYYFTTSAPVVQFIGNMVFLTERHFKCIL